MSTAKPTHSPGYTDQQRQAVETRHVSVSLSAGAGCGKTFVLTERYLAHLDPANAGSLTADQLGQLVAITFTDRAAREMRDRIRRRCYQRLRLAEEADAPYWSNLLRALDGARISTIHAFCANLLRARAVEAGLDPQFSVLEQAQADTLLSESVDDEIRRLIAGRDESTLALSVQFGLDGLRGLVRQYVLESTPQIIEQWLCVSPAELVQRWADFFAELQPRLARELSQSEAALAVLEVLRENEPSNPKMSERRTILLDILPTLGERVEAGESFAELLAEIKERARVVGGGKANVWPSPEAYETFKNAAEGLRKKTDDFRGIATFDPAQALPAAELGLQLLEIAAGIYRAYAKRKSELRVLDFSDLLIRARALLAGRESAGLARQLSENITLLLVDEFQDTDPLQVELVEALCGEGLESGKLFFVGDYKQSIYRFRGADPHVFRRLRDRTPAEGRQTLSLNFRSQPAILDFVNALFRNELGDAYEPLKPHRPQVSPTPVIEFLWAPSDAQDRQSVDVLRRNEADWMARRLRAILDSGEPIVWDAAAAEKGTPATRPAECGDICILLRALTNVEAYETALRKYEIDYYLVGGRAFYAQQEIYDLLNLLRALNSPADLVSLIGALRSPFFSLTDETLFWLAQQEGGVAGGLFAAKPSELISTSQRQQVAFAAATITRLRESKDRLRISELIELALELTGYDAVLLNEFLGSRKLANLLKLTEQARAFQRGDFLGLAEFITRLAEFVARQPDEPLAATHSEDTNVVRLMSVHQSKGLEFPIVVVPDMSRVPNASSGRVRLDSQLGPLARLAASDDEPRAMSGYDLWRHAEKSEEAAEMNRLLYVATTRAADYLLLSGGVQNLGDAPSPWMKLLARQFDLLSGEFLGDVSDEPSRPEVRVTSERPEVGKSTTRRTPRADLGELSARLASIAPSDRPVLPAVDPIPPDASARWQFSFSRLAGSLHRKYERLDEGAVGRATSVDPRGLGTLVHAVLAVMDFTEPVNVPMLVELFAEQHLPDAPGQVQEAIGLIERFAASHRAQQIAAAQVSHAEVEFLLAWKGGDTAPRNVSLRGYLDRLYQDDAGAWHVLDFKTNQVGKSGVARQAASYEMQMYVYGLAAERILKTPPASLTLHFLRTGEEHSFAWDDAARTRVVEMVDEAMEAALLTPAVTLSEFD